MMHRWTRARLYWLVAMLVPTVVAAGCANLNDGGSDGGSGTSSNAEEARGQKWFLSDLMPLSDTNGWGDIEFDTSNGDKKANDGRTITLGGQTYERGLGVHAPSEIVFQLDGRCSEFVADIGVDDETKGKGSVIFQVLLDDTIAFESDMLVGLGDTQQIKLKLRGARKLRLVVTDANNGTSGDHADWANTYVICSRRPPRLG